MNIFESFFVIGALEDIFKCIVRAAREQLKNRLDFFPNNSRISLEFVHPNHYWDGFKIDRENVRAAWVVRYNDTDSFIETWVDAETGMVIGGDRTR